MAKLTPIKRNTKVKEGDFLSLSETRAKRFADKAHKTGRYHVHTRPRFAKPGWTVSVVTK